MFSPESLNQITYGKCGCFFMKSYPETVFVNLPMMHSWGQRVVRFYDPDGNLIEVGASI